MSAPSTPAAFVILFYAIATSTHTNRWLLGSALFIDNRVARVLHRSGNGCVCLGHERTTVTLFFNGFRLFLGTLAKHLAQARHLGARHYSVLQGAVDERYELVCCEFH